MAQRCRAGSISRWERARQAKAKARERCRQARQGWKRQQAGRTDKSPLPTPQARGYLISQFWQEFGLSAFLTSLGIRKFKGLAASTLLFIALLFGVMDAHSISDLTDKVRADPVLIELCAADMVERKQLYRFLGKLTKEQYQALMTHVLGQLQAHPRTASRPDGVVAGDETTILKWARKMPGISWVFKASEQRVGLGYEIVSTCYADRDKFYSLFCDFRLPTPEEMKEREQAHKRKELGLDQRKAGDVARWLEHQVAEGDVPELVVLAGNHLGRPLVGKCEALRLPWIGISTRRRVYILGTGRRARRVKAGTLLEGDYRRQWHELKDEGYRVAFLGEATAITLGQVVLLVIECLADGERQLLAARPTKETVLLEQVQLLLARQAQPDNTKLHLMLDLLRQGREAGIRAETATFDRWFYVVWFIQGVLALGFKRVVIKAKVNISYLYQGQEMTIEELKGQIKSYRRAPGGEKRVKFASLRVIQPGLGRVRLVFVQEFNRKGKLTQEYVLMCTDPRYANHKVWRTHKLRWRIEEIYREVRQNHGFEDFHCRNFNAIYGHVALSFLSHLCLTVTRLMTPKLRSLTLGKIKHEVFNALVELVSTADQMTVCFTDEFLERHGLPAFCT